MYENIIQNNTVNIIGKVVSESTFSHDVYGEGFYMFYVEVPRLSESTDELPVTISERLIDREILKIGTVVDIQGQFRSYNSYQDKKNKLVLTIFAREVTLVAENEEMNKNPNQVFLNGYICKPPIYRTTPFGREIVDMLLAVNRPYNKSDYIPCIAWGRNARYGGKLAVGDHVKIWGRIQSREYQKKIEDAKVINKVAYEISISKMEIHGDENNKKEEEETEV